MQYMAEDDVEIVMNAEKRLTMQQCRWEVYGCAREISVQSIAELPAEVVASA
jgi:hypothetical protein